MSATAAPAGTALPSLQPRGRLLRILGVGFGVALIVGNTIGSGILRTPGEIASRLGSSGLILAAWLIGGLYALLCTISVTELGTTLPYAGGWYVYSRRAFGEYAGFVVGCSDWTMQTVAMAYLAVAFGEFSAELLPALRGHVKLASIACLSTLMLLNWLGLRAGSWTQQLTSLIKALALLAFVAACFLASPSGIANSTSAAAGVPGAKGGLLLAFVAAFQAIVVSYDGWYGAIYFTEEDRDPARNLPRSSIAGIAACIAIFLLVNMALLHTLPMSRLAASHMPAADAAMAIFGGRGRQFILAISIVTAISTINATLLIAPRILFAMARDGMAPRSATSVNKGGTPTLALVLATLTAIGLVLSGNFDTLIAVASVLFVAVYLSGFTALLVLRRREPELPRPFTAWGQPWSTLAVVLASAAFLTASVIADLKDALFTLVLMAFACLLYFLFVRKRSARSPAVLSSISELK